MYFDKTFEVFQLRYEKYYDHTNEQRDLIFKARDYPEDLTKQEAFELLEITDNGIFNLGIPLERVKSLLPEDKIKTLLAIFTPVRAENNNYLYFNDSCPYLLHPILLIGDNLVRFI